MISQVNEKVNKIMFYQRQDQGEGGYAASLNSAEITK